MTSTKCRTVYTLINFETSTSSLLAIFFVVKLTIHPSIFVKMIYNVSSATLNTINQSIFIVPLNLVFNNRCRHCDCSFFIAVATLSTYPTCSVRCVFVYMWDDLAVASCNTTELYYGVFVEVNKMVRLLCHCNRGLASRCPIQLCRLGCYQKRW